MKSNILRADRASGRALAGSARRWRRPVPAASVGLACLCALVALMVFAVPAATAGTPPATDWTVMVYMDGDQNHGDLNLEPWVTHDIDKELAVTGSNADVQVVALADRGRYPNKADGSWTGARVFHITQGMKATAENAAANWGQTDMGSPQTLVNFVNWARANYPAKHYALFMWDHGWGWWPGNTMEDDTSGDYMDMDELRGALQTVGGVDMVGWDSCFSQTIEVQAQFRGFAKAMAGSEDSIGYSGFAYDYILPRLQATPTMDAYKLAILAAKSMKWHHDKWTLASTAVALDGRWDTLTSAVSDLGWDLAIRLPQDRAVFAKARKQATVPLQTYPEVRDLYGAAQALKAQVGSSMVKQDCSRVLKAEHKAVLYEWHAKKEGALHGLAIFWPSWPAPPAAGSSFSQWVNFAYYCTQLEFTRLTYWGDFLAAWGH
jgi:hypothetical protein